MRKTAGILIGAALLSAVWCGTAFAGWNNDGGRWWYQNADGSYPSGSLASIDGKVYMFDGSGYMVTGWQSVNGEWYYFDGDGSRAEGWRQLDGKWYYLEPSAGGRMKTGWMDQDGQRYHFDKNGVMAVGVFYPEEGESGTGYAYQADAGGALIRNQTLRQGKSKIKYDEQGRITFRNAQTEEANARYGTDVWQKLLDWSQLDEIADSEETLIREVQDELWDYYEDEVKKAPKAERAEALAQWKEDAREELADLMSSTEIEKFISKVIGEQN